MKTLNVAGQIKVNGEWLPQPKQVQDEHKKILELKIDEIMKNLGFKKAKTL